MKARDLEGELLLQCRAAGLPTPERQRRVCSERRWRWDLYWPWDAVMLGTWTTPSEAGPVACEVQGSTWANGRHSRGAGYRDDCRKANTGVLLGVRVLRFTAEDVDDGTALETITKALGRRLPTWNPIIAQVARASKRTRKPSKLAMRTHRASKLPERVRRAAGLP